MTKIQERDTLTTLDRAYLKDLIEAHPRSSIVVTRGFFDGSEGRSFGSHPNDWDGITLYYEFKLTRNPNFKFYIINETSIVQVEVHRTQNVSLEELLYFASVNNINVPFC